MSKVEELERRLTLLQQIADLEGRVGRENLDQLYEHWRLLASISDMEDADRLDINELRERAALLVKIAEMEAA